MKTLKAEMAEKLSRPFTSQLATITLSGKPWVRTMLCFANEEGNLIMITKKSSLKVKEIENNPEVHVSFGGIQSIKGYFQLQGKAEISYNQELREKYWSHNLTKYFSDANDPEYALIIIRPYRAEMTEYEGSEVKVFE